MWKFPKLSEALIIHNYWNECLWLILVKDFYKFCQWSEPSPLKAKIASIHFSAGGQRSPKVGHFHLLVSVIQIASVIVRAFSKDRPARTFAWLLRGEHNALQWTERSVRKPTISWQIAGKEIFRRPRQDEFRSRGRTASQESFFSTHLHICFKRELFRLGSAIAALDKYFNYFSVRDKKAISISSTDLWRPS